MNLNESQDRIRWILVAVVIGATILLIALDSTGSLDIAYNFLEDPFSGILSWTTTSSDAIVDSVTGPRDIREAQAEIDRLQNEVAGLQRENEELREIEGE